jgi:hypothetical protein
MFFIWLVAALAVYQLTIDGAAPVSVAEFARVVFTTSAGWALIIVSNGLGLIFGNRGKFPGGGSQGLENVIQARDGGTHP